MNISHVFGVRDAILRHKLALDELFHSDVPLRFCVAIDLLTTCVKSGGKILICGNGGSAADAQHLAAELVVRYKGDREPISAIALSTDGSVMTAAHNDGYEVFQRQVEAHAREGDLLIALSTSGTSQNVIQAIYAAKNRGIKIIGLTGQHGFRDIHHPQCDLGIDVELRVPSVETAVIQELHVLLYHALVEVLERRIILCPSSKET